MNPLLTLLSLAEDQAPAPEDVKAGWLAFAVFLLLVAAVVFLAFSLAKHLRRAKANLGGDDVADREAGQNGESPAGT